MNGKMKMRGELITVRISAPHPACLFRLGQQVTSETHLNLYCFV